jgi:hypothetical protein
MATIAQSQTGAESAPVEVIRQPGVHEPPAPYAPPALLHVGDEVDALLAVRLDPTQEEDEDE